MFLHTDYINKMIKMIFTSNTDQYNGKIGGFTFLSLVRFN
jgi:hypothetical protein